MKFTSIIASLLLLVAPVFAQQNRELTDAIDKLTPQQRAELLLQATKQVEANKSPSPEDIDKQIAAVDKWVTYGTNIGKGLSGAAKEMGVAVNEFAKTPVGMLTAVIITWKFMGDLVGIVVHVGGGIGLFVFGNIIVWAICRQLKTTETTTKEVVDKADGKVIGRDIVTTSELSDESGWAWLVCSAIVTLASIIIVFTW